jgi:hypothetical protein
VAVAVAIGQPDEGRVETVAAGEQGLFCLVDVVLPREACWNGERSLQFIPLWLCSLWPRRKRQPGQYC